jgi:antitoxin ParD1/3/4
VIDIIKPRIPEQAQEDVRRLRQLWDAGVASGSAGEADLPKLRDEARRRLEEAKPNPHGS